MREGDVVWVSAAAGAVGSIAAQIAKLRGHRVIGSAGSAAKVAYLRDELGLDAAFNYHEAPVVEQLRAAAPEGIDVYFDNVGGEHLEAALAVLRRNGRAALCGAVSDYKGTPRGPRNLFQATANDLTLRGFRGSSHVHRFPELHRDMTRWLAEGLSRRARPSSMASNARPRRWCGCSPVRPPARHSCGSVRHEGRATRRPGRQPAEVREVPEPVPGPGRGPPAGHRPPDSATPTCT